MVVGHGVEISDDSFCRVDPLCAVATTLVFPVQRVHEGVREVLSPQGCALCGTGNTEVEGGGGGDR